MQVGVVQYIEQYLLDNKYTCYGNNNEKNNLPVIFVLLFGIRKYPQLIPNKAVCHSDTECYGVGNKKFLVEEYEGCSVTEKHQKVKDAEINQSVYSSDCSKSRQ